MVVACVAVRRAMVPKEVSDEPVTPEPKAVLLKTFAPLIAYESPEFKFTPPVTARFVVVAFVVVAFETERLVIVLVPLFARMPPESVASPDAESVVNDAAPAVRASAPMLMLPKFDVMEPESRMPTDVSDEPTTAEPKAVAERVLTPLMVSERPDARFNPPETERFVVVAFVVVAFETERFVMVEVAELMSMPSVVVSGTKNAP